MKAIITVIGKDTVGILGKGITLVLLTTQTSLR